MNFKYYLKELQSFPDRASAHENERKASKMIEGFYKEMGYEPKVQKFTALKHSWLAYFLDFSFYFAAGISVILGQPLLAILLTFLGICSFFGFPLNMNLFYMKLFPAPSQSVYVKLPAKKKAKNSLVVVGHYDTGKVIKGAQVFGAMYNLLIRKDLNSDGDDFKIKLPRFFQTPAFIANIILICLILSIGLRFTIEQYYQVPLGIAIFWSVAHLMYISHVLISPFVPGALDNGSGASIAIALADHFKNKPLNNTDVYFLNSGAEENRTVSNGAANFVKSGVADLNSTYFINLECLGEKHLVATIGESDNHGAEHKSDPEALKFLENYTKSSKHNSRIKFTFLPIASDASSIERNGGKMMTTLVGMSERGISNVYHTMGDTIEKINYKTMQIAFEYLKDVIIEFDKRF